MDANPVQAGRAEIMHTRALEQSRPRYGGGCRSDANQCDTEGTGSLKLLWVLDLSTVPSDAAGAVDSVDELVRRATGGARASLANRSRLYASVARRCSVRCW